MIPTNNFPKYQRYRTYRTRDRQFQTYVKKYHFFKYQKYDQK